MLGQTKAISGCVEPQCKVVEKLPVTAPDKLSMNRRYMRVVAKLASRARDRLDNRMLSQHQQDAPARAFHFAQSMLLARLLLARKSPPSITFMSRHLYLDSSPPPYHGPTDAIDKNAFRKTMSVLGARISPERTRVLLKANELRKCVCSTQHLDSTLSVPSACAAV